MFYNLLIFPLLLYLLNLILVKFVFLIDKPSESFHKIEKKNNIHLSGGLFIFFCLILLSLIDLQFYVEPKILFFLILILILGIFSDIRSNFSPKVRIIFQLFIIIFFVTINEEILINKTNIEILDLLLNSKIGKYLFTIFCIITLLNGFNFMDGVNGFVLRKDIDVFRDKILSIYNNKLDKRYMMEKSKQTAIKYFNIKFFENEYTNIINKII